MSGLFDDDELVNKPKVELTIEKIMQNLAKEREKRKQKGDYISMGCTQKEYIEHKSEIDKKCDELNNNS